MIRSHGLIYLDGTEVEEKVKTEEGKAWLERTEYFPIRWHKRNAFVPGTIMAMNRRARRRRANPTFGFMKNNAQDRTKHKNF